jgi:CRISPR-associated protein Cmr4
VWVTSPLLLEPIKPPPETLTANGWPQAGPVGEQLLISPQLVPAEKAGGLGHLNLGWLKPVQAELTKEQRDALDAAVRCGAGTALNTVLNRLVIAPDRLIAPIVNSNLEVRTSVSIDPHTGAAEDGALFTYEALPRGSWLTFEVVYSDPDLFRPAPPPPGGQNSGTAEWITRDQVQCLVRSALKYFQYFGVGGMNTRGFGRLAIWEKGQ